MVCNAVPVYVTVVNNTLLRVLDTIRAMLVVDVSNHAINMRYLTQRHTERVVVLDSKSRQSHIAGGATRVCPILRSTCNNLCTYEATLLQGSNGTLAVRY